MFKDVNLNVNELEEMLSDFRLSEDEFKVIVIVEIKFFVSFDKLKLLLLRKFSLKDLFVVKVESVLELMDVGMLIDMNKMKSGVSFFIFKTGLVEVFIENKEF